MPLRNDLLSRYEETNSYRYSVGIEDVSKWHLIFFGNFDLVDFYKFGLKLLNAYSLSGGEFLIDT